MTNEIQNFDMTSVQKRVSDTIKANFAMMIPDEAFDAMCITAIHEFMETDVRMDVQRVGRSSSYNHGSGNSEEYTFSMTLTPFKLMIWVEIQKIVAESLKTWIESNKARLTGEVNAYFTDDPEFNEAHSKGIVHLAKLMAGAREMMLIQHINEDFNINLKNFALRYNLGNPLY